MGRRSHFKIGLLLAGMLAALWGCPSTQVDYVDVDKSADPGTTAVLYVPDYIEVHSVDDQVIEKFYTKVLYSGARVIHIPPGPHTVVLRYNDIWDADEEAHDHEKIRSEYIGLGFTAVSGGYYRIEINEPDDLAEAEELAADFKAWIVDKQTGRKVSE
ncbi:MAG: DUF2057 family protein [Deltaproteobacteria bacterium]|nr:DUF2057 family protein [Deltaproteobacteria bacterium]